MNLQVVLTKKSCMKSVKSVKTMATTMTTINMKINMIKACMMPRHLNSNRSRSSSRSQGQSAPDSFARCVALRSRVLRLAWQIYSKTTQRVWTSILHTCR